MKFVTGVLFASVMMAQVEPVPFTAVTMTNGFWASRIETNRTVTIPDNFKKCEDTGRIDNFAVAARMKQGEHKGLHYDDSDVFKVMEGAAYSLSTHPDPALDKYLDELIAKVAGSQEKDGYLYTIRTISPEKALKEGGPERWSQLRGSHELYNVGHMYEAAVAHFAATGKRSFLDVAIKNANLVCDVFGPNGRTDVPGHQEIEIGLVKLYRATGDEKYLRQAKLFLDRRGHREGRVPGTTQKNPEYNQDHVPVAQQTSPVGHAVRALYMYSGMTDVSAATKSDAYLPALKSIWANMFGTKVYLTGGLGAQRSGESFGTEYVLPNATAYNETCAAIGGMLWNYRLFLLTADSKYLDIFERILYNGFLSGVSLEGNSYFYPNPLEADGKTNFNHGSTGRAPWFRTSCCPTNICRFLPSLSGYVYSRRGSDIYVNLFAASKAEVGAFKLEQTTDYPWSGAVALTVTPKQPTDATFRIRIPGWARGEVIPGNLYQYASNATKPAAVKVNGKAYAAKTENGFLVLSRKWKAGDRITLDLPMPVRYVRADDRIAEDRGKLAIERGPLVYAFEAVDNGGSLSALSLPPIAGMKPIAHPELLRGVTTIEGAGHRAIPYYAWAHRGAGEMKVWISSNKQ